MEKFQLSELFAISDIGSASGLVYIDNKLFIISDSSGFLYEYNLELKSIIKHSIANNDSENIIKSKKPDFEAITLKDNKLHIFGSGSTQNRNQKIIFDIKTRENTSQNLIQLYSKLKTTCAISDDDLNIEGALFYNDLLYLFQRGNGADSKNGIAIIDKNEDISFKPIILPKINHIEATFTDAILVENTIFFLATAEDTTSTYEDGEVLGSLIGSINAITLEIEFTSQITDKHKFEGLTLFSNLKNKITFLLCEDNDTDELKSIIYKLEIEK